MSIQSSANSAHLGRCDGKHSGRDCWAMVVLPRHSYEQIKVFETLGWTFDDHQIFCPGCSARNIARAGPTAVLDEDWTNEITAACMKLLHRTGSYRDHDLVEVVARASEMAHGFAELAQAKGWTPA